MKSDDLDFDLPPGLIAQTPALRRSDSRLLHYRRESREIHHRQFADLPTLLRRGDLLVFNDARVIPARFMLRKRTGGRIEGLFVAEATPGQWRVMLKNLGNPPAGTELRFELDENLTAIVEQTLGDGEYLLRISQAVVATEILGRLGRMPLPPYIDRDKVADARDNLDRDRYQTVYASAPGAVAAPTAGLHFTPELLRQIEDAGVGRAMVTLAVGLGTFKPITADFLEDHVMHSERYSISVATAAALNRTKRGGGRIIAVGTTAARVLESQPSGELFKETHSETSIFIRPPYVWKHVGAMITNFHLPRSTLIALVAAMVGLDQQRRIYRAGIAEKYRFFSYGDAMFIE